MALAAVAISDHRLHCLEAPLANIKPNMEKTIATIEGISNQRIIGLPPPRKRKMRAKTEAKTNNHAKEGKRMPIVREGSFLSSSIEGILSFLFYLGKTRLIEYRAEDIKKS